MHYVAILSGKINRIITKTECSYIYYVEVVYVIFWGYVFLKLFLDKSFFTVLDDLF